MRISFSPVRRDDKPVISKVGDALTINGQWLDFGQVPNGATLPREAAGSDWIASDVERINGVIHLTLILPHGAEASDAALFPKILNMTGDGPVKLPE